MSSHFDTMQVCKKWGHVITDHYDTYPLQRQEYCDKCGSETTTICEFCNAKIRGYEHFEHCIGGPLQVPAPLNCYQCGKPYKWRKVVWFKITINTLFKPAKYFVDSIVSIFKK